MNVRLDVTHAYNKLKKVARESSIQKLQRVP